MEYADPDITEMDYVRAALFNALEEGLCLGDVVQMAIHAETAQAFDTAVNLLVETYNG